MLLLVRRRLGFATAAVRDPTRANEKTVLLDCGLSAKQPGNAADIKPEKRRHLIFQSGISTKRLMNNPRVTQLVLVERVERLIHLARGEKVLLDADLAKLYGVTTGNLNKAVKRNLRRFPPDFMFQLTQDEAAGLIFQSGRSKERGGRRHNPFAFTEQGVAMLSSVLRSERAVQVNVAIMRAFVGLRRMLAGNEALSRKLAELERRLEDHDEGIKSLFDAIRELMTPPGTPRREMGFHIREDSAPYRVKRRQGRASVTSPSGATSL